MKFYINLRASYADTDQMGFVHHSNYVRYMEIARWEAFRELGISYKYIEESDILMPVIDMELQFIKPIFYDDLVKIGLEFHIDRPTKLGVRYLMHNQSAELVHRAKTTLAFLHKSTKKPCAMPDFIKEKLSAAYDFKILN